MKAKPKATQPNKQGVNNQGSKQQQPSLIMNMLVILAGLVAVIVIATRPNEVLSLVTGHWPSNNDAEYSAVTNSQEPSYLALVKEMKTASMEPVISEFSVHKFDDETYKYRRDNKGQISYWEVYLDSVKRWAVIPAKDGGAPQGIVEGAATLTQKGEAPPPGTVAPEVVTAPDASQHPPIADH